MSANCTNKLLAFLRDLHRPKHMLILKMKLNLPILALFATIFLFSTVQGSENGLDLKAHPGRKIVCYFGSWSVYRAGAGKFDVETIDPFLCTHLIFGFTGLRNGVVTVLDEYNDVCENWGQGALNRFALLKLQNPRLKTMAAIGGWTEGSKSYSEMASSAESRAKFINSVISFLNRFGFDGFDLDWEFPTARGGVPEDKKNFALLVKEMRTEFDKQGQGYILSAAVAAGAPTISTAYDVPTISSYLDFINVMTYDFHGAWDKMTGHHSPMYRSPLDSEPYSTFNVNHSIHYWISQGAHREKLVLGMGSYGRGVLLEKEENNGLYAPGSQPLPAGQFTREPGYWGYNEICDQLKSGGWTVKRDSNIIAPYAYKGRHWVGYDDIESIQYKSQYVRDNGLGGGMVWSLETDDFQGICHGERYPLVKTMYRTIIGKYPNYKWEPKPPRSTSQEICRGVISTSTAFPSPTESDGTISVTFPTTTPRQIETPPHEFCKQSGAAYADPSGDCQKFVQCALFDGMTWTVYHLSCGPGTVFSPAVQTCVLPGSEFDKGNNCTVTFVSHNRQGAF